MNKQGSLRLEGGRGQRAGTLGTDQPGTRTLQDHDQRLAFSLFPYPYRLRVCRQVKPKPTTVTHIWLTKNAQDTFCRITSTGVPQKNLLVAFTLGSEHTQRVSPLPNGTCPTILLINNSGHTHIHTYMQTMFFVGRGGDCSALPCLPLFHDN